MRTNFFALMYPGHGGGNWFTLCTNNHPAGMSVVLELHKALMLDLENRGLDPRGDYVAEGLRFLKYRTGKDACVGIIKGVRPALWRYMEARGGRRLHVVRNPLALIGKRWNSRVKDPASVQWNERRYGRKPKDTSDMFEGYVMKYAFEFYGPYLRQAAEKKWPLVRLEDLNASVGGSGLYYQRVVEWLTQTPWPMDYVAHIKEHYTPGHWAHGRVIFDNDHNVLRVLMWPLARWKARLGQWGEDSSEGSPPYFWKRWKPEWHERYLKHFEELEKQLGYNQDHIGSTDERWEFEGVFGEAK